MVPICAQVNNRPDKFSSAAFGLGAAVVACLLTSCTSLIMDKGVIPRSANGHTREWVHNTYGQPIRQGPAEEALEIKISPTTAWGGLNDPFDIYEVIPIRGPYAETDVTKQLEMLYVAAFTLGISELVTFPAELIKRGVEWSIRRKFLLLYDSDSKVVCVCDMEYDDGKYPIRYLRARIDGVDPATLESMLAPAEKPEPRHPRKRSPRR